MFCWARREFVGEINKLSSFQVIRWLEKEKVLLFWQKVVQVFQSMKWLELTGLEDLLASQKDALGGGTNLSRLSGKFHVEFSVCQAHTSSAWREDGKDHLCLLCQGTKRVPCRDGDGNFPIQTRHLTSRAQPLFVYLGADFHHVSSVSICICKREIWRVIAVKIHAHDLPYTHCVQLWDVNFIGVKKITSTRTQAHRQVSCFVVCILDSISFHPQGISCTLQKHSRVLHFFSYHFGFQSARLELGI